MDMKVVALAVLLSLCAMYWLSRLACKGASAMPGPVHVVRDIVIPKREARGAHIVAEDLRAHLIKCFPETADQRGHYEIGVNCNTYRTLPNEPYYTIFESGEIRRNNLDYSTTRILWDGEPPDPSPDGMMFDCSTGIKREYFDKNGRLTIELNSATFVTIGGKSVQVDAKKYGLTWGMSRKEVCEAMGIPFVEEVKRNRPTRNGKRAPLNYGT